MQRPSRGWANTARAARTTSSRFCRAQFGVILRRSENFSNGFLPANHQASFFHADGTPIDNIQPADKDRRIQETKLALLQEEDGAFSRSLGNDDGVESAIRNYEMAYRMQSLVPDLHDLGRETQATQQL